MASTVNNNIALCPGVSTVISRNYDWLASWDTHIYEGCPESIRPFLISREPFPWPWCDLAHLRSKVSSDWLPNYINATRPVLVIFKMDEYFPDSPPTYRFNIKTLGRDALLHKTLRKSKILILGVKKSKKLKSLLYSEIDGIIMTIETSGSTYVSKTRHMNKELLNLL